MHLKYRNVNSAFQGLVAGIHLGTIPTLLQASRAGEVCFVEEPVTVTYERPRERVLFNSARDANPFFHLYESLWMLAGRNDIAPLSYYSSNYAKQVQDADDSRANGAYGFRWREHPRRSDEDEYNYGAVDQLELLIDHLRRNPYSRRAVLQMWTVEDDLLKIGHIYPCDHCKDGKWENSIGRAMLEEGAYCPYCRGVGFRPGSKDVCCNTCVYFSVGLGRVGDQHDQPLYLNMTVCNRSNDLIWGMLGANVVHFSILQEYMAAHLGLRAGIYNQFTNNLHIYTERWEPEKWLECESGEAAMRYYPEWSCFPLVKDPAVFDRELPEFVERHSKDAFAGHYSEPFLAEVAQPMMIAFHHYKRKEMGHAQGACEAISADDWRIAATQWIKRRTRRAVPAGTE